MGKNYFMEKNIVIIKTLPKFIYIFKPILKNSLKPFMNSILEDQTPTIAKNLLFFSKRSRKGFLLHEILVLLMKRL